MTLGHWINVMWRMHIMVARAGDGRYGQTHKEQDGQIFKRYPSME